MATNLDNLTYVEMLVRGVKESTVAEDPAVGDIAPVVFFERGGEAVAMCTAYRVDRDEGLTLADVGIRGFAADAIIFVVDAHHSAEATNPLTGKPWGPGEMQNACDNEGACLAGVLQDTLLLLRVDRILGVTHHCTLDYDVDKAAGKVVWHERKGFDDGPTKTRGLVADVLNAAFQAPTVMEQTIASGAMPVALPEIQQGLVDDSTIAVLAKLGGMVAVAQSAGVPEAANR